MGNSREEGGEGAENIWLAASDGKLDLLRYWIEEAGVDVNAQDDNGYSPLHAAASWGHVACIDYLMSKGANIHLGDADGDTPLHVCDEVEIAQKLIAHLADPLKPNSEGQLPIDVAHEDDNEALVEYLKQVTPDWKPAEKEAGEEQDFPEVTMSVEDLEALIDSIEE